MKLLLVNSCYVKGYKYPYNVVKPIHFSQPIELCYIASAIQQHNDQAYICDRAIEQYPNEINEIEFDWIILGVIDFNRYWVPPLDIEESLVELMQLRKKYPNAKTIVLSPNRQFHPKLRLNKNVDYVLGSEFWECVEIIYKKNYKKKDILSIVPAYDLLTQGKYSDCYFIKNKFHLDITSLGCNYSCKFCTRPFGRYDEIPIEVIRDKINKLADLKIKSIFFHDDNITYRSNRLDMICNILKDYDIAWRCMSRVDTLNKNNIVNMSISNCKHISMGIESGNNDVLKKTCKNITTDTIISTCDILNQHNITYEFYIMIGSPGETLDSLKATVELIKHMDPKNVSLSIPIPYIGTRYYSEIENNDRPRHSIEDIMQQAGTIGNSITNNDLKAVINQLSNDVGFKFNCEYLEH